jgi:hypothetical protein
MPACRFQAARQQESDQLGSNGSRDVPAMEAWEQNDGRTQTAILTYRRGLSGCRVGGGKVGEVCFKAGNPSTGEITSAAEVTRDAARAVIRPGIHSGRGQRGTLYFGLASALWGEPTPLQLQRVAAGVALRIGRSFRHSVFRGLDGTNIRIGNTMGFISLTGRQCRGSTIHSESYKSIPISLIPHCGCADQHSTAAVAPPRPRGGPGTRIKSRHPVSLFLASAPNRIIRLVIETQMEATK